MRPPPGRPSPPAMVDDLIGEILLRLPPDEPEWLFRASLVCKPWRRLLSGPAFLRRYRAFHRVPPVLGFLRMTAGDSPVSSFVPTTAFRAPDPVLGDCDTLDCRHGRALLCDYSSLSPGPGLLVWDPITGDKQWLPEPDIARAAFNFNAAVLCATIGSGCDHLDCHGGPFFVAYLGDGVDTNTHACLYSSETGTWSATTSMQLQYCLENDPPVLVGDTLYFSCRDGPVILRYDVGGGDQGLSVFDSPGVYKDGIALMLAGGGGLGFAGLDMFTLHLWSLETGPDGVAGWERRRVIDLEMLPIPNLSCAPKFILYAIAKGCNSDIVFVSTDAGVFMVDLESKRVRKVCETDSCSSLVPYTSFCTPGHASGGLPPPSTTQ